MKYNQLKIRFLNISLIILLFFAFFDISSAQTQRFPKPEFESGHQQPPPITPSPRAVILEYLDVVLLIAALALVSYFALKKRSRRGIFYVSVFSLLYFGFWRHGCICSVGSIQNIALAIFNTNYLVPISVIAFFAVPLLFALFTGRTFCAGVCPLGAIQDFFILRPLALPKWVQTSLGIIPYFYLAFAVLFAALGSEFIICRYDPFVGFFRFDASFDMLVLGGVFLVVSIFVARPYCRFFCPYGVLLNWMSKISKKHLTITPAECINCRLCENSCPFGAILTPAPAKIPEETPKAKRRLIILFALLPVFIVGWGWIISQLHVPLSQVDYKVRLAEQVYSEKPHQGNSTNEEILAFKSAGKPVDQLYAEVQSITEKYYTGSWIVGCFIGLVFGLTLIRLSVNRYRSGYVPDQGTCLSCGRCMDFCPVKR